MFMAQNCKPLILSVSKHNGSANNWMANVGKVDAVICAVSHKAFADFGVQSFVDLCSNGNGKGVLVDVKCVFKRQTVEAAGLVYWSL